MDDHEETENHEGADVPGTPDEPPSEPTQRVRIIGATQVGTVGGVVGGVAEGEVGDAATGGSDGGSATERFQSGATLFDSGEPVIGDGGIGDAAIADADSGEPAIGDAGSGGIELPHWTDPPTGQVPTVLDRRADDDGDPQGSLDTPPPVWREHDHDWEQAAFEPSLLGEDDDTVGVGALADTPVEERRPWEFESLDPTPPPDPPWEGEPGVSVEKAEPEAPWDRAGAADRADQGSLPESGSGGEQGSELGVEPDRGPYGKPGREPGSAGSMGELQGDVASTPTEVAGVDPRTDDPWAALGEPGIIEEGRRRRGRRRTRAARSSRGERGPEQPTADSDERGRGGRRAVGEPGEAAGKRDVPVAIVTGLGFGALALVAFALGPAWSVGFLTLVVTAAVAEGYAALRKRRLHPATLPGLLATVALMLAVYARGLSAAPVVIASLVVASFVWHLARRTRGQVTTGVGATLLVFLWVGFLGSFAALLVAPGQFPDRHGIAFLLGAIVATVAADTGALAVGRWIGRHPMAPVVSPHKTWEGLLGGSAASVVVSALVTGMLLSPWTPGTAAVLGVVVAIVAPLGDLAESLVKRELGLKDMGSLLPGHGGLLDRLDALLFVLPATYYLVRLLKLG
ncbi:MAG: phosphatidate cytidylyltransferase [Actinomycetota bacterium]|nr:phosphatidate cytidylyltransferase [Actinomycetota bacterium]